MNQTHQMSRLTWLCLLSICVFSHTALTITHDFYSGPGFMSVPLLARRWDNTTFSNLTLAPYINNVSTTYAWVLPQNKYDIGAGAMACECFDPAGVYLVAHEPDLWHIWRYNADGIPRRYLLYAAVYYNRPVLRIWKRHLLWKYVL